MTDELAAEPRKVRGRPFEKGHSDNSLNRKVGCRNQTTTINDGDFAADLLQMADPVIIDSIHDCPLLGSAAG